MSGLKARPRCSEQRGCTGPIVGHRSRFPIHSRMREWPESARSGRSCRSGRSAGGAPFRSLPAASPEVLGKQWKTAIRLNQTILIPLASRLCADRRNAWLSSTCGVLDSQNLLPGRPSGGRCSSSDIRRSAGAPREVRRRLALSHLLGNKRRREKRERTISSDWCCAHSRTRGSPLRAVSGLKESE